MIRSILAGSKKPEPVPLGLAHSPRRIGRLSAALAAKSYLEIGVHKGITFREVAVEERVGVDPQFLFDRASLADAKTQLLECTSDAFFSRCDTARRFDFIFLDGLHTFEQTYRDFCNSLLHSHARTVWLIDDTWPADVYSSLTNPPRAVEARRRAGGTGNSWHGDVYKIVFAIHDFHPGMNYRTIFGSGNPQTLMWRSKGLSRTPLFNSLERISRLDYFDMVDHRRHMQPATEDEAIEACVKDIESLPHPG